MFAISLILHGWLTGDSLISLLEHCFFNVFNRLTTPCLHGWPTGDPLNSMLKLYFPHVFYRLTTQCLHGWPTGDQLISLVITKLSLILLFVVFVILHGDSLVTHSFPCWIQICINFVLCMCSMSLQFTLHGWLTGDSLNSLLQFNFLHVFNW